MIEFVGLFNDNGEETKFRIHLDPDASEPYLTRCYLNHKWSVAKINESECIIPMDRLSWFSMSELCDLFYCQIEQEEIIFKFHITKYLDEIILSGKENFSCYLPCTTFFIRPRFFVACHKV